MYSNPCPPLYQRRKFPFALGGYPPPPPGQFYVDQAERDLSEDLCARLAAFHRRQPERFALRAADLVDPENHALRKVLDLPYLPFVRVYGPTGELQTRTTEESLVRIGFRE